MASGSGDSLVSIVLTVYNKPQWLRQSIDSVLTQTYGNWELLIMEDNSPDKEVHKILAEYKDPRIKMYFSCVPESKRYETARYATLINLAVRNMSKGDFISYLTDDDYYYPHRLEKMVAKLGTGVDVVYGAQQIVDADGNPAGIRGDFGDIDWAWNLVDHNSVMHTRDAFDIAGGWDDDPGTWGGADSYFWRRLTEAGFTFYTVGPEPNEAKRYHTDSIQWLISNHKFPGRD